jgi:hypothetical protein
MKVFPLCLLTIVIGIEAVGIVPPQKASHHLSQASQTEDVSLLKPRDVAYAEAMEFARFLNDRGINVKSVHRSKFEGFFRGIKKAAFFRTDKGIVEVIFFPDLTGAERISVTEQRKEGWYLYSFQGQPEPNPPGDTIHASRQMYFLMSRNWFIVPDSEELYDVLKRALMKD